MLRQFLTISVCSLSLATFPGCQQLQDTFPETSAKLGIGVSDAVALDEMALGNPQLVRAAASTQSARRALEQSDEISPEDYEGFEIKPQGVGKNYSIATPHPVATQIGAQILANGGTAVDAAVASSIMLTLVEPFASGIGGGGFMVLTQNGKVTTFDGREIAPLTTRPDQFMKNGKPQEFYDAVTSGYSVGVPGLVQMLHQAHQKYGKTNWFTLVAPVAAQARAGFYVSERLRHHVTNDAKYLKQNKAARRYFYDATGKPWPVGHVLQNPQLAEVLDRIAVDGPRAFYQDVTADNMMAAVNNHPKPGALDIQDFVNYQAIERAPVCGTYRKYKVCGMGPPSAGGIATIQALNYLEPFAPAAHTPAGVHLIAEAIKLAYADRDTYIADPAYTGYDQRKLINDAYLAKRTRLMNPVQSRGTVNPGAPFLQQVGQMYQQFEPTSTSHISIVDRYGNAVALTSSIENLFGSRIMVDGFLLNNQLTDFAFEPTKNGQRIPNSAAPGKRPRSSMSPTIVLDQQNKVKFVLGSPGGSRITPYVIRALVDLIDHNRTPQDAVIAGNISDRNNGTLEVEKARYDASFVGALQQYGHQVTPRVLTSGLNIIAIQPDGTHLAATDPRREGYAYAQ